MQERAALRAGIFILAAIAVLTVGIFSVRPDMFRRTARHGYRTVVSDARFLREGRPVTIAGLVVGRIESVAASDRGAEIAFYVDRPLRRDCRAVLKQDGLMGQKYLEIVYPEATTPELPAGAIIPGEVMRDLSTMAEQLRPLVEQFTGEEFRSRLDHLIQVIDGIAHETESLSAGMRFYVDDLEPRLRSAIEEARTTVVELRETVAEVRQRVVPILDEARPVPAEARRAVEEISRAAGAAREMLQENRPNVYATTRELRDAARHANLLVQKIRSNPAVLLFGDKEEILPSPPVDDSARRLDGRTRRYD